MKLGLKEILVGATLATAACDKPQSPQQPPFSPIEECRARVLEVVKNREAFVKTTGIRMGSWDSAGGKEWQACLEEKKLPLDSRLN